MMKKIILTLFITLGMIQVSAAQAQDNTDEPPFGLGELEAYSVFVDAYRSEDYDLALDYGRWMIEAAPREIEGYDGFRLDRQFDRMVTIYTNLADIESDPTEKTNYLEEAEQIFERAFEIFDEEEIDYFEWHLKKGRFYHENHEHLDADMNDALVQYETMYEMDRERFVEMDDGFYAQVVLTQYASNGEREKALAMIDDIEDIASANLLDTVDQVRESLFENPEERIEFFESRIADAGDEEREEMLRDLMNLYSETGQNDNARQAAMELYELNPDFENSYNVAELYLSDGNYSEGLDYLLEAIEQTEDETQRKEISLEIAETYQQLGELPSARDYARQAIDIDSGWGDAYMRMASIYAAGVSECTGGDTLDRNDRTVYWLILDYLDRAKQADPSMASAADSRAQSYQEAMPSAEDKFFNDWEDGQSFQIDGDLKPCYAWINETTTVR